MYIRNIVTFYGIVCTMICITQAHLCTSIFPNRIFSCSFQCIEGGTAVEVLHKLKDDSCVFEHGVMACDQGCLKPVPSPADLQSTIVSSKEFQSTIVEERKFRRVEVTVSEKGWQTNPGMSQVQSTRNGELHDDRTAFTFMDRTESEWPRKGRSLSIVSRLSVTMTIFLFSAEVTRCIRRPQEGVLLMQGKLLTAVASFPTRRLITSSGPKTSFWDDILILVLHAKSVWPVNS
jgi:hypothetical protein